MKDQNYYHLLLDDQIYEQIPDLLPPDKVKNLRSLTKEIDDIFRAKLDSNSKLTQKETEGLNLLIKWLERQGGKEWNEFATYFPTFEHSYTTFFMESFNDEEKAKAISIKNSGKQDSLLKLAESEVTAEQLDDVANNIEDVQQIVEIVNSGTDINNLATLSALYPNGISDELIAYATEENRKKKEFNNLLSVGSKVEKLFKSALKMYDYFDYSKDIIHAGGGAYDIRIKNSTTGKSFYIELKSCKYQNTDPIHLAMSQVEKAVKQLDQKNFALIIIERPANNEIDEQYIRQNTRYLRNPGQYLGSIQSNHEIIKQKSNTGNTVDLKMESADFNGILSYQWLKDTIGTIGLNELLDDIRLAIQ